MSPFAESNDLLDSPAGMRKRMRTDGYLFFRDILPEAQVLDVRRQILEICEQAGWLRPGARLIDGLSDRAPISDNDEEYADVYARVQALEAFHGLKLNRKIIDIMEVLFEEEVFPFPQTIGRIAFPRDNARGTQAHQDWIFVGGSTETISCWIPLGDVPLEVGGLKVLEGSHKSGFLEPQPAPGPGGRIVEVDPRLVWRQSEYGCGDILLFKMLTVHAAADNLTRDKLRLSADFRYTGTSHMIAEEWFQPHFSDRDETLSWEALESGWRDSPVAHYWNRFPDLKIKRHEWFWEPGGVRQ
jgi:hypothetical protein